MSKDRNGYVYEEKGKWIARVTTTDETGKRRNIKRSANSKSEAKELLNWLFCGECLTLLSRKVGL